MDEHETGRWLVALGRRPVRESLEALRRLGAGEVAASSDLGAAAVDHDGPLLLERLGVAVLTGEPPVGAAGAAGPLVERERWVQAPEPAVAARPDGPVWGLGAVSARPGRSAAGLRVAVLDTGVDAAHPDLAAALAGATSLVAGEGPDDGNGHGTHCAGTVCGDPAYAVAPGARLYAGKVLGGDGRGREADVLAGLEWAVDAGCRVVSMSLASPGGGPPSQVFEQVASELLDEGVVLVAATGNESRRPSVVAPVGRPASCPSVLAVGAVGPDLRVAPFSNGGPELDVVAPGVDVLSSWPGGGHRLLDGTSMATPHVAGVVALLLAAEPQLSARQAVARLRAGARRLAGGAEAVGDGLVQCP